MLNRLTTHLSSRVWVLYISIALTALSACSSQPATVVDREQPPSRRIQEHRVSAGETLYSIAWRYDLGHRELARRNNIEAPFTIYPGQVLQLDVDNRVASTKSERAAPVSRPAPTSRPAATSTSQPVQSPDSRSKNKTASSTPTPAAALPSGAPAWRWPVEGRVLRAFGASTGLNQGIDISGNLGDSVNAAAPGQVVYAGSGLRGYGNLVILKHNDMYLSAYAHNRSLRVSEGDSVKAGEIIAEMGSSGTDKVKLYFEIRRDGKPVDPTRYLPRR